MINNNFTITAIKNAIKNNQQKNQSKNNERPLDVGLIEATGF